MEFITWVIPAAGLAAVAFALYLARDVMSRDTGTPEMVAVGDTIREGADAFVRRQYTTIGAAGPGRCGASSASSSASSRPRTSPMCPPWPACRSGS